MMNRFNRSWKRGMHLKLALAGMTASLAFQAAPSGDGAPKQSEPERVVPEAGSPIELKAGTALKAVPEVGSNAAKDHEEKAGAADGQPREIPSEEAAPKQAGKGSEVKPVDSPREIVAGGEGKPDSKAAGVPPVPVTGKGGAARIDSGPSATPSQNAVVNLINRLVQRGILLKEEADDLIRQAEADAELAAAQSQAIRGTVAQIAAAQAAAQVIDPPELAEDALRIPFIPDVVKRDLRDEIREDVMAKAREEGWAAPDMMPGWTARIRLFGDVRVRYDGTYFPKGNDVDAFPNFNAINTGAPYDLSDPTVPPPHLNVDKDRQRVRIRTRVGLEAQLGEGFTAGMRIASGQNNTPVSVNQSLGLANQGQGGNFSKYAVWLDRGFIKYDIDGAEGNTTSILFGKFDNPFFGTEMMWDEDIGFDGFAVKGKYSLEGGVKPFCTGGIFPVFNSDFNFATNHASKFSSYDKWLYALQVGAEVPIEKHWTGKVAAAVYQFDNVEGRTSKAYTPLNNQDAGDTDESRPSFAQRGNTYSPLRNILPSALNDFGQSKLFQYFGLTSGFKELAVTAQVDYSGFDALHMTFTGEYVKNLDFDRASVASRAVNNRERVAPNAPAGSVGEFKGGDQAWTTNLRVGSPALSKRGDWQVGLGYRYMESDAMVDAFVDSGFGLGGTNQQGYVLYGKVALSKSVSLGARWFSSREVAGPPLRVDVLQVDFGASF